MVDALLNWNVPTIVVTILLGVFIICQIVGEIIEISGKTVPVFFKIRKGIQEHRKAKKDKEAQYNDMVETLKSVKTQQGEVKEFLADVKKHYDEDNIAKRDAWMLEVNTTMHWAKERAIVYDSSVNELKALTDVVKKQSENIEKQQLALDLNNKMTSDMFKQSCRRDILDFEHKIINARRADKPLVVSREEFRKIRKTYDAYEEFLQTYGGTNGEVDDAMEVIRAAERGEYDYIEFLEDIR